MLHILTNDRQAVFLSRRHQLLFDAFNACLHRLNNISQTLPAFIDSTLTHRHLLFMTGLLSFADLEYFLDEVLQHLPIVLLACVAVDAFGALQLKPAGAVYLSQ